MFDEHARKDETVTEKFDWVAFIGRPTMGDFDCGLNLFFQITGTVVAVIGGMRSVLSAPWVDDLKDDDRDEMNSYISNVIYGKILNGMCVTMIFGSFYYAWMALRLGKKLGRMDVMSLPFGINAPAAFAFVFGIMRVAARKAAADELAWKDGVTQAWQVACVANLIAGLIAALVGFAGNAIMRVAPQASLLIPLAGLGLTYLGISQLLQVFQAAAMGFLPIIVAISGYFVGVNYDPVPVAVMIMLTGCVMGWTFGSGWPEGAEKSGGTWETVEAAVANFNFYCPTPLPLDAFKAIPSVALDNMSVILPVAFVGAINTLVSVYNAHEAGDFFDVRESLVIDGCTTMVSALFGSPFGACVFCGHKALKDAGGRLFYQLFCCVLFCFMSLTGQFSMVAALVPPYAIAPIILFVGLALCQDAFGVIDKRHLPAAIVGLMPSVAEWVNNIVPYACQSDDSLKALQALGYGALLSSIVITSFLVFAIDGRFCQAAIWAAVGAVLATFGIIHQPAADLTFRTFTGEKGAFGTSQCAFMMGYLTVAATCACLGLLQHLGFSRVPQKQGLFEDETEDQKISVMVRTRSENVTWDNLAAPPAQLALNRKRTYRALSFGLISDGTMTAEFAYKRGPAPGSTYRALPSYGFDESITVPAGGRMH